MLLSQNAGYAWQAQIHSIQSQWSQRNLLRYDFRLHRGRVWDLWQSRTNRHHRWRVDLVSGSAPPCNVGLLTAISCSSSSTCQAVGDFNSLSRSRPKHHWNNRRRRHLESRRLTDDGFQLQRNHLLRPAPLHRGRFGLAGSGRWRSSRRRMAVKRGRHNPFPVATPGLWTASPARPTPPATPSATTSSTRPTAEPTGRTSALRPGAPCSRASAASPHRSAPPSGYVHRRDRRTVAQLDRHRRAIRSRLPHRRLVCRTGQLRRRGRGNEFRRHHRDPLGATGRDDDKPHRRHHRRAVSELAPSNEWLAALFVVRQSRRLCRPG